MKRRLFLTAAVGSAVAIFANRNTAAVTDDTETGSELVALKSKAQWKELLSAQQYEVLFNEATERPWTSALNQEKRDGTYICAACNQPLFLSEAKFESGTGWPSFYQSIEANTRTKTDFKLLFPRTEYHCGRCGGHQGHVFNDGPEPTGQRWCNNGIALQFVPATESLPELIV